MPAVADARAVVLIALAYVISITAYSMLPEARWPLSATFSSGLGRLMIAFVLPAAATAIYTLLSRLAREPVAAGPTPLKSLYSSIIFVIVLFVVGLHAVVLIGLFGGTAVAYRAVPVLLGFMFVVVGNLLPRTRPNTIVGIRTPATLADRPVWMRVNRFAGYVAVALGIVLIAAAFFPPGRAARDLVSAAATSALALLVIGYRKHSRPTRVATAQRHRYIGMIGWMLRVPVVLIFLYFGAIKFPDHPESPWPKLFAAIGLGQWFRYATGAIEVAAAFLLLIPRTSRIAVAALACTMLGAILTHIFVVGITPAILLPIILLAALMLIIWAEYARTRR